MRGTCTVEGCDRAEHARGLCGMHYQRMMKGADVHAKGPGNCDREGWSPPAGLSPAWHDSMRRRARPAAAHQDSPCALQACGGTAVQGSPYCAAHKAYREAQARLKAKGMA